MKIPRHILVKLSPLAELARGEPLIEPFATVAENNAASMRISSSYGEFVFDKATKRIARDGIEISSFDAIESVDINNFPGGRGEKSWSIVLYRGFLDRITVARTYDDGDATVLAAKIARLLDCKVVSLVGMPW